MGMLEEIALELVKEEEISDAKTELARSLMEWCNNVEKFVMIGKNELPNFSDVVDKYKQVYGWYKRENLKLRKFENRRKEAEKKKPEKEPEFTNDREKDNNKADAYLESYKTYFSELSKIMGKKKRKKFNLKSIETNITNGIIKNNKISAQKKLSKFKKEEEGAIDFAKKFSEGIRKLYLKEKKALFGINKLKNVKTIMYSMRDEIKDINEIDEGEISKGAKLEQLLGLMDEYSKRLEAAAKEVRPTGIKNIKSKMMYYLTRNEDALMSLDDLVATQRV